MPWKNRHRTFYTTMPKRIPKEVLAAVGVPSLHEFKKLKRAQMRELLAAVEAFSAASAYTPGYSFWRMNRLVEEITCWQRQMRTNRWVV